MNKFFTGTPHVHGTASIHSARGWGETIEYVWKRIVETLWLWHDRARQRRQLSKLTSYQLDDIGISPSAAAYEADKPFWRS